MRNWGEILPYHNQVPLSIHGWKSSQPMRQYVTYVCLLLLAETMLRQTKTGPNPPCIISQRKLWNQPLHTLDTRDTSLYFWLNYNWLLLFLCPSIFHSFEYSWASCLLSPQFSLAHLCWRKQLPPGRSTSRNWLPIGGGHLFWCFPTVYQHLVK